MKYEKNRDCCAYLEINARQSLLFIYGKQKKVQAFQSGKSESNVKITAETIHYNRFGV